MALPRSTHRRVRQVGAAALAVAAAAMGAVGWSFSLGCARPAHETLAIAAVRVPSVRTGTLQPLAAQPGVPGLVDSMSSWRLPVGFLCAAATFGIVGVQSRRLASLQKTRSQCVALVRWVFHILSTVLTITAHSFIQGCCGSTRGGSIPWP